MANRAIPMEEQERAIEICTTCLAPPETCETPKLRNKYCLYYKEFGTKNGKDCRSITVQVRDYVGVKPKHSSSDELSGLNKKLTQFMRKEKIKHDFL